MPIPFHSGGVIVDIKVCRKKSAKGSFDRCLSCRFVPIENGRTGKGRGTLFCDHAVQGIGKGAADGFQVFFVFKEVNDLFLVCILAGGFFA